MLILLLAIFAGACFVWLKQDREHFDVPLIGAGISGLILFVMCLIAVTNRMNVGAELAAVEQQRHAASTLHGINASQVYGDCVTTNQAIAQNKWYRHQWWSSVCVAPAWDTVSTIVLPDTTRR